MANARITHLDHDLLRILDAITEADSEADDMRCDAEGIFILVAWVN